jgi:hypothetical protein
MNKKEILEIVKNKDAKVLQLLCDKFNMAVIVKNGKFWGLRRNIAVK